MAKIRPNMIEAFVWRETDIEVDIENTQKATSISELEQKLESLQNRVQSLVKSYHLPGAHDQGAHGKGGGKGRGGGGGRAMDFDEDPWKFASYRDAPDNRPNIVSVAQAKEVRSELKEQGRLNADGRTTTVYHVTDSDAEKSITERGLVPGAQDPLGQSFEAEHSKYATYFHSSKDIAMRDFNDVNDATGGGALLVEAKIPITPKSLIRILPDEDFSLNPAEGTRILLEGGPVAIVGGVPSKYLPFQRG